MFDNHKCMRFNRQSYFLSICILLLLSVPSLAVDESNQERRLSFYNTHTHERLTVIYKKGDDYVMEGDI